MSLLLQFKEHINSRHLFSSKDKLVLAVSGGVDSVVLCELCKQAEYDFVIAHCNFKLRGEESERDEEFVKKLAKKYGVAFFAKEFETEKFAADNKLSIQEAARKLRYKWFDELVNNELPMRNTFKANASIPHAPFPIYLLTAHHADDNNETLLMNFFRGTGLHGLTGMPERVGYIRRPLLQFTREELLAFAGEKKLEWVEDSSNASSKYTRNFFRNDLLPAISNVYPQVKENLKDNIRRFKEVENLYQLSVEVLKKKLCRQKGAEVHVPVKQLMGYNNKALLYELIHAYGFGEKQVEELIKLSESESGRYIEAPDRSHRIIRHRHWFIISPVVNASAANIIIEKNCREIDFPLGKMNMEESGDLHTTGENSTACLDSKDITFPLLLRKWKTGDYFYPLGMKKKKKVARFLIDQKVSMPHKENTWVLESNKRILWVVGHRIDERFKITGSTRKALRFRLLPA